MRVNGRKHQRARALARRVVAEMPRTHSRSATACHAARRKGARPRRTAVNPNDSL